MGLDKNLIYSAVRVVGNIPTKKNIIGARRGAIGTGFLVAVRSETDPNSYFHYVVTAHHVLWSQTRVEIEIPDPATGTLYEPIPVSDWRQPLDDVDIAVAPITLAHDDPAARVYVTIFVPGMILAPHQVPNLGAEIYYIGILTPLDRPMVRSGTIGALDQTGIEHDGGYEFPSHLVDCRSYDGFSGSPCFLNMSFAGLTPTNAYAVPKEMGPIGEIVFASVLCGMFTEHLADKEPKVASRYGVGIMVRSLEIWEALMTDKMRAERKRWEEENAVASDGDGPRLRHTSVKHEGEFERFEELTRKLVHTPKPGGQDKAF